MHVAPLRSFEPGIGRVEPWTDAGGANTAHYHTDMLGTTRMMTGANGQPLPGYGTAGMPAPATFTAFGERVQGPIDGASNRYGYVGEHGYQAHEEFPWLHLGARYYDPAMGRFLQRDPIGVHGGVNVYAYASGGPTRQVDPSGNGPIGALYHGVMGAVDAYNGDYGGAVAHAINGVFSWAGYFVPVSAVYSILRCASTMTFTGPKDIPWENFDDAPSKAHVPSSNCPLNPGLSCDQNSNCPNNPRYGR